MDKEPKNNQKANIEEIRLILDYISKGYKVPSIIIDEVYNAAVREVEEKKIPVIIKRDPDFHRGRIQGAYPRIIKDGTTIETHIATLGQFGADFDGDTFYGTIMLYTHIGNGTMVPIRLRIDEFPDKFKIDKNNSIKIQKEDGTLVEDYPVIDNVYCISIEEDTGRLAFRKVDRWSIHKNVRMYSINRKKQVGQIYPIRDRWVSENHGLVAYDLMRQQIRSVTVREILESSENYFLLRHKKRYTNPVDLKDGLLLTNKNLDITDIELGYFFGVLLGNSSPFGIGNRSVVHEILLSNDKNKDMVMFFEKILNKIDISNIINLAEIFGENIFDRKLPEWFLYASRDMALGLLSGLIDNDLTHTSFSIEKGVKLRFLSKNLAEDLSYFFYHTLGIESTVLLEKNKSKSFADKNNSEGEEQQYPRVHYALRIPIRNRCLEVYNDVFRYIYNSKKKEDLKRIISFISRNKNEDPKITFIHPSLINNDKFTESFRSQKSLLRKLQKNSFTSSSKIEIPISLIQDSSEINNVSKKLMISQYKGDLEFIPCKYLDIQYDPNITVGYDLTINSCKTFSDDYGLFFYDSIFGKVKIYNENNEEFIIHLEKFLDKFKDYFDLVCMYDIPTTPEDSGDRKVVERYVVKEGMKLCISSISKETGEEKISEIKEFSVHRNINMYLLEDINKNRFEPFYASGDHSLIIYDSKEDKVKEVSPIELLENNEGKYLIKKKN